MQKRYNVFVSSVAKSLPAARRGAIDQIISMGHFPIEMTYFPASVQDNWAFVREQIDRADYFIVLVAGLYGSGFVRKEVEYAMSKEIPVLAFLHDAPETLSEKQRETRPGAMKKLNALRKLLSQANNGHWTTKAQLVRLVGTSLQHVIDTVPRRGMVPDMVIPGERGLTMPDSANELYAWNFLRDFYPLEFMDCTGQLLEDIRFDIFARMVLWLLIDDDAASPNEVSRKYKLRTGPYLYVRMYQAMEFMSGVEDIHWPIEDYLNKLSVLHTLRIIRTSSSGYREKQLAVTPLGYELRTRWPEDMVDHSEQEFEAIMHESSLTQELPNLDPDTLERLTLPYFY